MEGVIWRVLIMVVGEDYGWELLDVGTSDDITNMTQAKYIPVATRIGNATCSEGE
jgi:hypothetical protein